MSVSISEKSNPDLDIIIAGGEAFDQRMKALGTAIRDAREARVSAADLLKQAQETMADAERQLAENQAAGKRLAASLDAADQLQIKLAAKIEQVEAICRG